MEPDNKRRLLDADLTLERLAGDERLLGAVARTFTHTAPNLVAAITMALASNDMNGAFAHAQSLKRAVAAFEAPQVLNSVLNVERHALNEDAAAAAVALPVARGLVERLVNEVSSLVPTSEIRHQA
ncbi:MAG TPA: Hpt domain-containing protein [Burkholderiales bacterium]|nr:Hpt domain-containing protein [Burkholderiales bacterium]